MAMSAKLSSESFDIHIVKRKFNLIVNVKVCAKYPRHRDLESL